MLHPSNCNRFGLGKGFFVVTGHSRSQQSLIKARSFYVMIEYFCVATKFGLGQRFYVLTKCFYVSTKFSQGQEFLCCDRV